MKEILETIDWKRIGKNLLVFSAPALAVFFGQLALKVEFKVAALVALVTLYGALADFFRKFEEAKKSLE